MTNAEKYEELDGGCHCETWWNEEYKPNARQIDDNKWEGII